MISENTFTFHIVITASLVLVVILKKKLFHSEILVGEFSILHDFISIPNNQ